MIQELQSIQIRYEKLVKELNELWANPQERLEKVAQQDDQLKHTLEGGGGNEGDGKDMDTASEYSAVSQMSRASNLSFVSNQSGNRSVSGYSATAVSILSQLSLSSSSSSTTGSQKSGKRGFAIDGVEHAVLSRGGHSSGSGKQEPTDRQKRKKERKEAKLGRDAAGLRKEVDMCDELATIGDLAMTVSLIVDICEALLLLNTSKDMELIQQLHKCMNEFIGKVQGQLPVQAPEYPLSWLGKRQLYSVAYFQDNNAAAENIQMTQRAPKTWWVDVAEGALQWQLVSAKYALLTMK